MVEGQHYRALRFDSDVGKHGDTGRSEAEVVRAVLDGRADAGAIGSPFWKSVRSERLVPEGALTEIWTSPPYNHCMFTARPDFDQALERQFADALSGMNYDNPSHRAVLDAEGLNAGWRRTSMDMIRCGRRLRAAGVFQASAGAKHEQARALGGHSACRALQAQLKIVANRR